LMILFLLFRLPASGRVTRQSNSCSEANSALKVGRANGPVPIITILMKLLSAIEFFKFEQTLLDRKVVSDNTLCAVAVEL